MKKELGRWEVGLKVFGWSLDFFTNIKEKERLYMSRCNRQLFWGNFCCGGAGVSTIGATVKQQRYNSGSGARFSQTDPNKADASQREVDHSQA